MKRLLPYLFLLTGPMYSSIANAQTVVDCTRMYFGSSSRYPMPKDALTPAPKEYTPVFISYVGREGATHLPQDVAATFVFKALQKADSAKTLKKEGEKLRQMLLVLKNIEKPAVLNHLTISGGDDVRGIGERMNTNFKAVFKPSTCIKVSAVDKAPVFQSAEVLFAGLGRSLDAPGCEKLNLKDEDNLQPYKVSAAFKTFNEKGDWKDNADDYREKKKAKSFNTKFLSRFFDADFLDAIDDDAQSRFITQLFDLSLQPNITEGEMLLAGISPAQVDIRSFFTCEELEIYYKANGIGEFYKSAAGYDKTGIQIRAAVPLLMNVINTIDANSVPKGVAADIKLGSFESVASLAAILNFKDYSKTIKDPANVSLFWKAEEVIPTAANIQIVLYLGTSADTRSNPMVKFMLNENEVVIDGLSPKSYPYYWWDDVKIYLKKKLADDYEIGSLADNMHTYLLNLKAD